MMVVMDRVLAIAQPCAAFRTEWRGHDGGCMRGETAWRHTTSRDQHRERACLDRPRRSLSGHTLVVRETYPVLAGWSADGHSDTAPGVPPRGALRQVQHEPTH